MNRYDIAKGIKPQPVKAHCNNSFEGGSTDCSINMVKKETMSIRGLTFRCLLLELNMRLDLKKFSFDINMKVQGPHDFLVEPDNPFIMTVHGQDFTVIPTSVNIMAGIAHIYGWTDGCKFKRIKGVRENLSRPGSVPVLGIRGVIRVRRGLLSGITGIQG